MSAFLLTLDQGILLRRLNEQERLLARRLASLEDRLRRFDESDRLTYENWIRMEFGPELQDLERLYEEIRARKILARRVSKLIDREGMSPREALYVAQSQPPPETDTFDEEEDAEAREWAREEASKDTENREWDPDEIAARRQAKREAKREQRKQSRKEKQNQKRARSDAARGSAGGVEDESRGKSAQERIRDRLVSIYRVLVRKLHPDSPVALKEISPERARSLWHEVQEAYSTSNLERLLSIATWLSGQDPEGEEGELAKETSSSLTYSERLERLRSLEKSCQKLERRIHKAQSEPAWEFETKRGNARKKIRQGVARDIEEEFANAQEVMAALDELFDSIGPPRAPREREAGGAREGGRRKGRSGRR